MKHYPTLIAAIFALLVSSCSTVLPGYTPNAPLLEKKGDSRITGGVAIGSVAKGASVQAAYALSNHFYIGAGTSFLSHYEISSNYTDLSAGYFARGKAVGYEFSAGAGQGSFNYGNNQKDRLTRFHIQGAVAHIAKSFQIGGGLRVASNSYKYMGKTPPSDPDVVTILEEDLSGLVSIEPFLLMRAGGPKVGFQMMLTYPFFASEVLTVIPDPTLSLGVTLKFGKSGQK